MRPLTVAATLAAAAAAAITLIAAIGVRTRETALDRAAGPYDADGVCSCRVCTRLRGSGLVTRAIAETRAADTAAARLRAIIPDRED